MAEGCMVVQTIVYSLPEQQSNNQQFNNQKSTNLARWCGSGSKQASRRPAIL
jgi:hypothetical protein